MFCFCEAKTKLGKTRSIITMLRFLSNNYNQLFFYKYNKNSALLNFGVIINLNFGQSQKFIKIIKKDKKIKQYSKTTSNQPNNIIKIITSHYPVPQTSSISNFFCKPHCMSLKLRKIKLPFLIFIQI